MKIAIVTLPHAPIGPSPSEVTLIGRAARQAVDNEIGTPGAADHDVIVALFPGGEHLVVQNRFDHVVTVVNR